MFSNYFSSIHRGHRFVVIHRVMDDASTVFYLPESYNANFDRMVLYLAILFVARSITAAAIYVISNR